MMHLTGRAGATQPNEKMWTSDLRELERLLTLYISTRPEGSFAVSPAERVRLAVARLAGRQQRDEPALTPEEQDRVIARYLARQRTKTPNPDPTFEGEDRA